MLDCKVLKPDVCTRVSARNPIYICPYVAPKKKRKLSACRFRCALSEWSVGIISGVVYIISAQWKKPLSLLLRWKETVPLALLSVRGNRGTAAVNTSDSPPSPPHLLVSSVACILILVFNFRVKAWGHLVLVLAALREVTLWWCGEDRVKSPRCRCLFHLRPLFQKSVSNPFCSPSFAFCHSLWSLARLY